MNEDLKQLKALMNAMGSLNEADWECFAAIWKPYSSPRKVALTHVGETEKYLYFVLDGVQRVYYFDSQGREATIVFMYPPSFAGVLDSFMLQLPSKYCFETLSTSRFLRASFVDVNALMKSRPALQGLILQGMSQVLSGLLERLVELQSFSSEEKFSRFLARSPHILQLVPHKYLANYIGIDATNFSKLINKVKI
ncbi:Crp/Fnr family transcriptional regulator [Desertivirga xinjiangensis]|uniref:Crp/Fnr family transcriptional regulator n=1 Tax=Desertivirga xinjiangensis TaxID=539206 RepID=UPI00210CAD63|nr:Crp/Fnr family transcriptional regulator [Pedobacter xinjiangensis]